jgi:DNA-binding CsgD family transcriptional regulator
MDRSVQMDRLLHVSSRLRDAVIDPAVWPEIMQEICAAARALEAGLLQSDIRASDIPRTERANEVFRSYFANGSHRRDIRAERAVPLLLSGHKVVTDQDILTSGEIGRCDLHNELLAPLGFKWWAGIGFWAGSALWGVSIQRTPEEGAFNEHDKRAFTYLADRLTETATLSKAVGEAVLSGIINALDLVKQPALALDRMGFVLDVNAMAAQLFDDELKVCNRRLMVRDARARSAIDAFIDQSRTTSETDSFTESPILVPRCGKRALLIRTLPVDGAARSPFLGARALLLLSDSETQRGAQPRVLSQVFDLSRSEAKLAAIMAGGYSLREAASQLGIARETARNQLKAVFAKTGTHRQGELIALLSTL